MPNRNKNRWLVALAAGLLLVSVWTWSREAASLAVNHTPSHSSMLTFPG